jgi:selenide, water dikinase
VGPADRGNVRLTQYAAGGGCACKIPPGELERIVAALTGRPAAGAHGELLVGLDDGDDAAVVLMPGSFGAVGGAGAVGAARAEGWARAAGVAGAAGAAGVAGVAGVAGAADTVEPRGVAGSLGAIGAAGAAGGSGAVGSGAVGSGAVGSGAVGALAVGGAGSPAGPGGGFAIVATTDFFTPVVDDAYDWGRIAAANALSDVYAVGGEPVVALNLLGWPRGRLPFELAAEVLRGGLEVAGSAGCHVAGGHSIDDPEPKYGMAVTGIADPARLLRIGAGLPGQPLSLSKPLGSGVLNNRHKATGEVFPQAVDMMTRLNADASRAAIRAGVRCATDVTGFGLLGHLYKLVRASGVSAVIDTAAVPYLEGARAAVAAGYVSGGTRRNLDWVSPHLDRGSASEQECLLLADAQTSGGLLLAGEVPGAPVVGHLVPRGDDLIRLI